MSYIEYTVRVHGNGDREWKNNELLHREDGPAIEFVNGVKYWYRNGKLHREDGPAVEYPDNHKEWYINGKRHREDGPAIEYTNGSKEWAINGQYMSEKQFNARNNNPCDGKVVEIDGKKYKLTAV